MIKNIVIAGFGGQGILFAGKVLAQAALEEERFTTFFPSYGAEVRGGTAYCMVIISEEEIACPIFKNPDDAIILNEPSFKKFLPNIKDNGLLVVNSSLVKKTAVPEGVEDIWLPLTDKAREIGEIRTANLVALGIYLNKRPVVSNESVEKALKNILTNEKAKMLDINLKAFAEGSKMSKNDG